MNFSNHNYHPDDLKATFWEHLEALRSTLIAIVCTIAVGVCMCLFFYSSLLHWVLSPLDFKQKNLDRYELRQHKLINQNDHDITYIVPDKVTIHSLSSNVVEISPRKYSLPSKSWLETSTTALANRHPVYMLSPLEGVTTTLKICFWIGLVGTSPFWIFLLGKYLAPALRQEERKYFLPFLALSGIFLGLGAVFAYMVTIPLSNEMLQAFNQEIGNNLWSLKLYVDYTLLLILANSFAFEIALLLFFLVHLKILSPEWMQSKRRVMIFSAFVIGAALTPPDVLTQVMLALPLIGLYEIAIIYGKLRNLPNRHIN